MRSTEANNGKKKFAKTEAAKAAQKTKKKKVQRQCSSTILEENDKRQVVLFHMSCTRDYPTIYTQQSS